jgi:hypothetical protein
MAVSVNSSNYAQSNPLEGIAGLVNIYRSVKGIGADKAQAEKNALEMQSLRDHRDAITRRMDPNSTESQQARAAAADLGFKVSNNESADAIERRFGKTSDYYQNRFKEGEQTKRDLAKIAAEGTSKHASLMQPDPNSRLATASAEVKSKVGLIADALTNMTDYEKAFAAGENPQYINSQTKFLGPLVSDTKLTSAQRMLSEAVGRLQSGGAIGAEELKTFQAMGPRAGDDDDIKAEKIAKQRQFLENRLVAFGFNPAELGQIKGYDLQKLGYDSNSLDQRKNLLALHQGGQKGDGFSLIPGQSALADEPKTTLVDPKGEVKLDPKIDSYAKKHGMNYLEAQALLRGRGYGQ